MGPAHDRVVCRTLPHDFRLAHRRNPETEGRSFGAHRACRLRRGFRQLPKQPRYARLLGDSAKRGTLVHGIRVRPPGTLPQTMVGRPHVSPSKRSLNALQLRRSRPENLLFNYSTLERHARRLARRKRDKPQAGRSNRVHYVRQRPIQDS